MTVRVADNNRGQRLRSEMIKKTSSSVNETGGLICCGEGRVEETEVEQCPSFFDSRQRSRSRIREMLV